MEIKELKHIENLQPSNRLTFTYHQFQQLLSELQKRELTHEVIAFINAKIDKINAVTTSDKAIRKQMMKSQVKVLRFMEQKQKLVVQNYYIKQWIALGFGVFGFPLGMAALYLFGNWVMGMFLGVTIGMLVGYGLDRKAKKEGRQINMTVEYR